MTSNPTPRFPRSLAAGLLLATMLFLLIHAVDHIWASSSDFAHHYSLVARLSQLWAMPTEVDFSLGEMNIYPRGSHVLAALLGMLFHSPFIGMHLVTLLSMMGAWAALGGVVLSLPKRAGLAALAGLLILLGMGFSQHFRPDIFGVEDIVNFFYAQLVAQAFMLGAMLLALHLERRGVAAPLRYSVMIASSFVIASMHLLPASQLVCITLASIALDFLQDSQGGLAQRLRAAVPALLFMGAAVAALVLNPSFAAMREISKNDGELFPVLFTTPGRIAAYSVLILLVSALLTWTWVRMERALTRHFLALKYIGLFGLAASALCLLQIVLLHLGQGSAYAVKKHIFALNSVFFAELALLPSLLPALRRAPHSSDNGLFYGVLALPLLTAVAFLSLTQRPPYLDASDVANLEHQLELRRDLSLPPHPGKHVYVMDVPGMPGGIHYMMSIGVFSTPRTANSLDVLGNKPLSEPDLVGIIITGPNSTYGQMEACRLPGSTDQLAMVEGVCATRELRKGRRHIGFTIGDGQPGCALTGFSGAEPSGRWRSAADATIECQLPQLESGPARSLVLGGAPFLANGVARQRLNLRINDGAQHSFEFVPGATPPEVSLPLPPDAEGKIVLHLALPDAVSPKQLGMSNDARQLAWMLKSLDFK
jgi:hypothetical protein